MDFRLRRLGERRRRADKTRASFSEFFHGCALAVCDALNVPWIRLNRSGEFPSSGRRPPPLARRPRDDYIYTRGGGQKQLHFVCPCPRTPPPPPSVVPRHLDRLPPARQNRLRHKHPDWNIDCFTHRGAWVCTRAVSVRRRRAAENREMEFIKRTVYHSGIHNVSHITVYYCTTPVRVKGATEAAATTTTETEYCAS